MSMLIVVWCLYHLLEYVATVALWSWLGDLTPRRIRGRLLGGREQWLLIGRIVGIGASALLATLWSYLLPSAPQWQPLALSAEIGAVMMLFAVAPLAAMPAARGAPSALPRLPWRSLARAALDPQYRRLLAASCWIAAVNGLTQAPQELYPIRVLRLPYAGRLALLAMMRAGQSAIAPWMGRLTDRLGNRPVMIVSQFIAATGTLFLLAATPEYRWLLIGAYVVWIAYAGLNVGLDNAKLKLAPPENNAPYLAVYHAMSDLAGGAAIVAGGVLFDQLAATAGGSLHHYAQIFIWAWLGRTSAVILLARLIEPDARGVSEFVAG
jgi:MFS family permease